MIEAESGVTDSRPLKPNCRPAFASEGMTSTIDSMAGAKCSSVNGIIAGE